MLVAVLPATHTAVGSEGLSATAIRAALACLDQYIEVVWVTGLNETGLGKICNFAL